MRRNNVLCCLLAALLILGLLAGCTSSETAPEPVSTPSIVPDEPSPAPEQPSEPTEPEAPEEPAEPEEPQPEQVLDIEALAGLWFAQSGNEPDAWLRLRTDGTADYTPFDAPEQAFLLMETDQTDGTISFRGADCAFEIFEADEKQLSLRLLPDDGEERNLLMTRIVVDRGDFLGRPMTEDELDALTDSLSYEENGFFLSTYVRPEEIDWHEVCYNGAGIAKTLTEEDYARYTEELGELFGDVEVIAPADLERFVREKTGTSYAAARNPLNWEFDSDGNYIREHGDTNLQGIRFTEGYVDGYEYQLYYNCADWKNWIWDRPFVMRARIQDGNWIYRSNYPADAPEPMTLLRIDYVQTREEAEQRTDTLYETQPLPSDEPYGWCWAVITAQTDQVRYVVDRAASDDCDEFELRIPGECLASGVLDQGESFAIYVNQPWHPELRVMATLGERWGEFFFGEDNWLHLADDEPRWVTGRDLNGEGRGCYPENETNLARFLCDGNWAILDENTGEVLGALRFRDYRTLDIMTKEHTYEIFLTYERRYADDWEAPDVICMEKYSYSDSDWSVLSDWTGDDFLGEYQWSAGQYDGEQILYLNQSADGVLDLLLGVEGPNFSFHRYRGTTQFEPQG